MSFDFSKIAELSTARGKLVELKNSAGRVIWAVKSESFDGTLKVAKITSNTYAGETTYNSESFILLDIYPKTNGTVTVAYGDLTKTITDTSGVENPNAQQVFFGTFNGVSDDVETPASGELTIEGDCYAFGCGSFNKNSKTTSRYSGITAIGNWEQLGITGIPEFAFTQCSQINGAISIPDTVLTIGGEAFAECSGLESITIPSSVVTITGDNPFWGISDKNILVVKAGGYTRLEGNALLLYPQSTGVKDVSLVSGFSDSVIPSNVTKISTKAFYNCLGLVSVTIPTGVSLINSEAFYGCTGLQTVTLLGETPPTVGSLMASESSVIGAFPSGCTFVVPKGCGDTYKTNQYWKYLADRIVEAS